MRMISFVIAFIGIIIFIFSYFINFKNIEFDNFSKNDEFENQDEKENSEFDKSNDDFDILLKSSKTLFRGFGFFIILVGVFLYIYSLFYR